MSRKAAIGEANPIGAQTDRTQQVHMGSPDQDDLRVFCLGPLRAFRGVEEVQWNGSSGSAQKMKTMFGFLLNRKKQGARKETLIDLLWPRQTDRKRADSNLHLTVHCLRRTLEPELRNGSNSSYIRFEGGRYYFHPQRPCRIDVDIFERHYVDGRICEQNGELDKAVEHWSSVVDACAGDYMADIQPDYIENLMIDWCLPRRRRLREHYLTALEKLADHHYQIGAINVATKYAYEALNTDPAFEPAHRIVMQCLVADGQPDMAVRQFQLCVSELADSEGRFPSRRTRQIYESLVD